MSFRRVLLAGVVLLAETDGRRITRQALRPEETSAANKAPKERLVASQIEAQLINLDSKKRKIFGEGHEIDPATKELVAKIYEGKDLWGATEAEIRKIADTERVQTHFKKSYGDAKLDEEGKKKLDEFLQWIIDYRAANKPAVESVVPGPKKEGGAADQGDAAESKNGSSAR